MAWQWWMLPARSAAASDPLEKLVSHASSDLTRSAGMDLMARCTTGVKGTGFPVRPTAVARVWTKL